MNSTIGGHQSRTDSSFVLPREVVDFYDPDAIFCDKQSLLVDAILSRPPARGLGKWDLAMTELQSAGISESALGHVAAQADMLESTTARISEIVQNWADELADGVLARMRQLTLIRGGRDQDVVLASAILSASSHRHDKPRLSGGPYFNHPRAVAKIISIAWHHHADKSNELDLHLKQSIGLLHDSWENMFSKKPISFMHDEERILITPFSYARILGRLGVSSVNANNAKNDLYRVTKQPSALGVGQDYENYIFRSPWHENSATAKIADIHHNLNLDGKPVVFDRGKTGENSAKRILYREAPFHIRHSLDTDKMRVALMLGYIDRVTLNDLSRIRDPVLDAFNATDLEL